MKLIKHRLFKAFFIINKLQCYIKSCIVITKAVCHVITKKYIVIAKRRIVITKNRKIVTILKIKGGIM